ncbi:hypothetical protein BCR32DRAFT_270166 [Anaeromyces robustus]|uniref:Coth-domain-containing protein n=1 Tax=Anaeromyces robustus TaxID=1754192 RepID=A0A1Y1WY78_9FUNG|nr:hypothetical protein BCR32DRAFT_270166 [Anaeromyces robustus]|eukprot:ORX78278.1 hypothetical protein BCR32DRAFT_270166 [Anaeromyces robustus]
MLSGTLSIFFALLSLGNAMLYQFNVVSIMGEGYSIGIKYNGNNYAQLTSTVFPLFSGTVNANNIDKYKYVIFDAMSNLIEEESIERTYTSETSKINEVYNRTNKKVTIPELPKPFDPLYKMGSDKLQPLPNNVIYNIYAKCDENVYNVIKNVPFNKKVNKETGKVSLDTNNTPFNCTFNIISPDGVYQRTGVIRAAGYGSRTYKKLSWILKLDKKFMGRKTIKIRGSANDPTLMRERLATQLYIAVGVPVQEGAYTRFYINGDTWGLYNMVDSLNKNWIANYVHGNDKAHVGTTYKLFSSHPTGPYSELKYKGEDHHNYTTYEAKEIDLNDPEANPAEPYSEWKRLIKFTRLYDEWMKKYSNDNSDEAVKALEEFLELESCLRTYAIETLTFAGDNFWLYHGNVALYYNPETNKYQFLSYDFDESFTLEIDDLAPDYLEDCITWNKNVPNFDHYFSKGLLSHPQIKERYDKILGITARKIFNLDVLTPYINANADLIKEDVTWNFDLIDKYNTTYDGKVNHFTYKDFEENIGYGKLPINPAVNYNNVTYGLEEIIQLRSDNCKAYTKDIKDISKYESSSFKLSNNNTIKILFLLQFVLYFLF